ncbi:MAG: UDP-4-amino-4,6-dideoxy-N-acetyl-beta-L-altrosamine N-acetyltransferase [Pseudonocardiaceae bacterium]
MRLALRPLCRDDAPQLLRWRNSPAVARNMYSDHEIGAEEHEAWLNGALEREDARYWIITADGVDAGFTSVTEIDPGHGTCSWAIYIGSDELRGRGAGSFALFTVLERVFGELGLRKLSCEVLAFNTAALSLYERFGLVPEGRLREQIVKHGEAVDVHRLGILDREWRAVREQHRRRLTQRGLL